MSERNDQLKGLIQNGQIDQSIKMVQSNKDYGEGEAFVFTVLREEKSTPELVEAALEAFLGARKNCYKQHGYWVHSLSHFTRLLWEHRMDSWIKKFYEVSFRGANELADSNCSNRLVSDFVKYAKFNDDPVDFALTSENLRWMDWEKAAGDKVRVEAGLFESEDAFLRWKICTPEVYTYEGWDFIGTLVDSEKIRSAIQRLKEIGVDTSEFNGLESGLLTKQLNELEGKFPAMTSDWERDRLQENIQKTRDALVQLND